MSPGPEHGLSPNGLTTCHECDLLHVLAPVKAGVRAYCKRCGALLYRDPVGGSDRALALALSALGLFIIANVFPFLALELDGRVENNVVASGIHALWLNGMPDLAILVCLTSVVFPGLTIVGLLWLLLPLKFGRHSPGSTLVVQMIKLIGPWTLLSVFMLGALIAFVKLQDIASVIPGVSLYAFALLIVTTTAASNSFNSALIWPRVGPALDASIKNGDTAHQHHMRACHTCQLLIVEHAIEQPAQDGHPHCPRCGAELHQARKHDSLMRTWALLSTAVILIVPANLYPIMTVIQVGRGEPSTIVSGVIHLIAEGMWGLGLIVFVASVVVPVTKLLLLTYLLISVQRRSRWRPRERMRLYRITETVGAWSMVDIFLVGILCALVNIQSLANITPEIGASFFAGVVVVTMLAAHSFDPRLIWDHAVEST